MNSSSVSAFGIGAVARLTGIPMDTLRIWERRYQAVAPVRSGQNRRFYSRDDVTRLMLIKQLVDLGNPVSSVVNLPEAQLRERLEAHAEIPRKVAPPVAGSGRSGAPVKVLAYGDVLPYQVGLWEGGLEPVRIIGAHTLLEDFERDALAHRPDVLLMEFPALQADAVGKVRELLHLLGGGGRCVVVYAFANRTAMERLEQQGVICRRAPVTPAIIVEACEAAAGRPCHPGREASEALARFAITPRRFDGETLAAISVVRTPIQCECPQHLVDLLSRVSAFESYSLDCENRNPADAVLHARLYEVAGRVRMQLEDALEELLAGEGISLPVVVGSAERSSVT